MTVQPGANLYSQGFGSYPENVEVPVVSNVNPNSNNTNYPIGKRWVNQTNNSNWVLTSLVAFNGGITANWEPSGGASTNVSTISGDVGVATPTNGNIQISGSPSQLTTTASGSTVTIGLVDPFVVTDLTVLDTATINATGGYTTSIGNNGGAASVIIEGISVLINATAGTANVTSIGSSAGSDQVLINSALPLELNAPASQVVINTLSLENTGGLLVKTVHVSSATYNALASDYFIGVTSAVIPITVNLPSSPPEGTVYVIADVGGFATTNAITISGNGNLINVPASTPQATFQILPNFSTYTFIFHVTHWSVMG